MEDPEMKSSLNPYELARQRRIMENKRRMQELGLDKHVTKFSKAIGPTAYKKARKKSVGDLQVPKRVSQRLKINANGTETSAFRSIENGNNRFIPSPQISVESEELEALTSKPGTTCHWCRQKTTKGHVECTSESCGSQNRLRISFCEMCLRNRIGEDFQRAVECGNWICPKCRGSCGPGCNSCCNCGPCRKLLGLGPTYQMVKQARLEGFSNVHDYLIHKQTGEKPETIAARKHQYAWCR